MIRNFYQKNSILKKRVSGLFLYPCAVIILFILIAKAQSNTTAAISDEKASPSTEYAFFQNVNGPWTGSGEVVSGKYKGTRFYCMFQGRSPSKEGIQNPSAFPLNGLILEGACRIGIFSQPMLAQIIRGINGFTGVFNDGAKGGGFDIISGKISNDHMIINIKRNQIKGAMLARLETKDKMNITISAKLDNAYVPIIGLKLSRKD